MRCNVCGRFMQLKPGTSSEMVYSGEPKQPDHEIYRCVDCTQTHGALRQLQKEPNHLVN